VHDGASAVRHCDFAGGGCAPHRTLHHRRRRRRHLARCAGAATALSHGPQCECVRECVRRTRTTQRRLGAGVIRRRAPSACSVGVIRERGRQESFVLSLSARVPTGRVVPCGTRVGRHTKQAHVCYRRHGPVCCAGVHRRDRTSKVRPRCAMRPCHNSAQRSSALACSRLCM
jgi:hypothetical protein